MAFQESGRIGGTVADADAEAALSKFPDWCDPSPWLWRYVCEQYVAAPVWCTVFVADGVALWLIAAILLRQREQERGARARRLALPRAARARRLWRAVGAVARLATLAAGGSRGTPWREAWARVSSARTDRRQYLLRREFDLSAVMTRAAGPMLVLAMLLLIAFEVHAFYTIGQPWLGLSPLMWYTSTVVTAWIFLRIAVDYACTSLTDPGRPEADADAVQAHRVATGTPGDVELGKDASGEVRKCRHCNRPKPPRCHHCKVCRRCVSKMDHHCPFVNNCVGLHNYRHFCRFLLNLVLGCSFVALALAPQVPGMLSGSLMPAPTVARRVHVVVAFLVAVIADSLLGSLLYFHLQLIAVNETTLEHMGRRFVRPRAAAAHRKGAAAAECSYSHGALENFSEVCGPPPAFLQASLEIILRAIVPSSMVRLAKRSE